MFEQHFGLTKRPFDGQATGADVFVSPSNVALIGRAKKIFAGPDAVACISGPVGCGKTTLVARSLAALGRQHTIIHIGRIKLGPDEVLDFLLRELGLKQMPAGTIQKITVFRNILKKLDDSDIRLFVVVEDAVRLGNVALAELEALTATDSGVSEGANLVLMSEASLKPALKAPGLARLKQRARLHATIGPMTPAEVRGYLTHSLRQAGGNISGIMTDDSIHAMHALTEGVARVVNNLTIAALESAADKGMQRLEADELANVASNEFGIELDDLDATVQEIAALTEAELPAVAPGNDTAAGTPTPETDEPAPVPSTAAETPAPNAPAANVDELPDVGALDSGEYPIPELIQDTLPDLEVLSPELLNDAEGATGAAVTAAPAEATSKEPDVPAPEATAERAAPEPEAAGPIADTPVLATETAAAEDLSGLDDLPELPQLDDLPELPDPIDLPELTETAENASAVAADATDADDIPTLFDSSGGMESPAHAEPEPPSVAQPAAAQDATPEATPAEQAAVPDWDRDPTLAELKPDLEALEHAMAVAQGISKPEPEAAPEAPPPVADADAEEIPQITLDDSIRRKIDFAEEALNAGDDLDAEGDLLPEEPAIEPVAESATTAMARDIGDATTEPDGELERIAAELAKARTLEDVDDKMAETLFGEEFSMIAAQIAASVPEAMPDEPAAAEEAAPMELSLAETGANIQAQSSPEPAKNTPESSDLEQEFRETWGEDALEVSMETTPSGLDVSASQRLATVRALNAGTGKPAAPPPKKRPSGEPQPIEDQINTSITQTLKTLNLEQMQQQAAPPAEEEPPSKTGFFSRFRKS